MKNITLIVLSLFVALFSCDNKKKIQDDLFNQVMEVHDEVMPKMGSLMSLSKRLNQRLDSLNENKADSTSVKEMESIVKNLEDANEDMMQWMRDFEPVGSDTPHEEVVKYLSEEKKKIDKVKEDMLGAEKRADKYFLEN